MKHKDIIHGSEFYKNSQSEVNVIAENTQKMLTAMSQQDNKELITCIENDLEPAALQLYPELCQLKKLLEEQKNLKVFMSGSGSTFIGLSENREHVMAAAKNLKNKVKWLTIAQTHEQQTE